METMTLDILGCGSASPTRRHNPAGQILEYRGSYYMIDCGEGSQKQMAVMGLSPHKIQHIFLSHLHGDHCLGLVPLLSSMGLHQKGGTVTIHTFAEGVDIFRRMIDFFCGKPDFDIRFETIDPDSPSLLLETKGMTVESFPLRHRVPDVGFIFREKPKPRHLLGDMLEFYNVPLYQRNAIKLGADFTTADGRVIPNSRLTTDPSPSVSYAYCSDTAFDQRTAEYVDGVDLLYHEATYGDVDLAKAAPRGHSTARQAAEIARLAGVGRLLLGHFSKASDEEQLLREAREVFPATELACEGMRIEI
ncbi:MAG: ribonuclease Z [Clostridium sp.]|nr:ribonuclease Z [Clostridium sp.]